MSASDAASHSLPLRNCYWVVPGLLLAGEHPNGPTRDKTKDRLKKLLDAGIECFVDLTKPTELLRYDTFLPFYVEYTRKSIKDHGIPSTRSQMVEILEYIANSMRAGRPVYVHCRAGIGRTGTVVGCLLAERGMQGQATIDELNRLWQQCRRSRSWPFIPETDAQSHYVREWQPSLDGGFELSSLATAVATVGSMSTDGGVRGRASPGTGAGPSGGSRTGAGASGAGVSGAAVGLRVGAGSSGTTAGSRAGAGSAGTTAGSRAGAGSSGVTAGSRAGAGSSGVTAGSRAGAGAAPASTAGARSAGAPEPTGVGSPTGATGPGGVDRRAGAGGSARVGRGANGAVSDGANGQAGIVSAAGRPGGIGAGLRAAAEQARAAVARGEVQVKAPPVPNSTAGPTATPTTARGRAASADAAAPGANGARRSDAPSPVAPATGARRSDASAPDASGRRDVAAPDVPRRGDTSAPNASGRLDASAPDAPRRGDTQAAGTGTAAGTNGARRTGAPESTMASDGAFAGSDRAAGANGARRGDASDSSNTSAGGVSSGRRGAPSAEFERGEISPSIRAEIADAMAGRAPPSLSSSAATAFPGSQGTASPNAGEEAPWAVSAPASLSDTARSRKPAQPPASPRPGAAAESTAARAASVEPSASARGSAAAEQMAAARAAVASELAGSRGAADSEPPAGARTSAVMESPAVSGGSAAAEQMAATRAAVASELVGSRGAADSEQAATSRTPVAVDQSLTARSQGAVEQATTRGPVAAQSAAAARAVQPPVEEPADSDPLLDPDTLAAARGLRERFLGTMFGLAVGDAVAAATQFRRPGTFTPIGDMLGGGPFDLPRGAYSDDTAMALCLAESLLERDGFDARDQVQRYSRWQQDGYLTSTGQCVGITANTARSLALAKWRRGMVFPGSHDPEQSDPEPLSRIASVALFYFASLESTQQQAVDSSRVTCQAPAVLDACRRLSRVLNAALAGQPKAKILAEGGPINEATVQASNTAAAALNAALWAFSSTDNFRDAVLRAANVGGNSDVVATVVGQIAGAHYGASAIPASWRSGLIQKDLIEGIADRLLAHGLVSLSS